MRRLEVAGRVPFPAPRLDQLAVVGELHHAGVRIAAVAVADEDVAVRRDEDGRRHVERVRAIAGHASLAERHQELPLGAELEHLMPLAVPLRILAVRALAIAHPDVPVAVDMDAMWANEHAGAETPDDVARLVELQNRGDVRFGTVVSTAPFEHPDAAAIAIDGDAGRRPHLSAVRHFEEIVDSPVGIDLGGDAMREREHHHAGRERQHSSSWGHDRPPPSKKTSSSVEVRKYTRVRRGRIDALGVFFPARQGGSPMTTRSRHGCVILVIGALTTVALSAQGTGRLTGNPTPGTPQPAPPNLADRVTLTGCVRWAAPDGRGSVAVQELNIFSSTTFVLTNAARVARVPPGTGTSELAKKSARQPHRPLGADTELV